MINTKQVQVCVVFKGKEFERLEYLAHETGRSRAGLIRRLFLATDSPEVLRMLGANEGVIDTMTIENTFEHSGGDK